MGTSTRWPGPKGGAWVGPNRRLQALDRAVGDSTARGAGSKAGDVPPETDKATTDKLALIIQMQLRALGQTIRNDPDAYGLQNVASQAGARLVDILDALASTGPSALGPPDDGTDEARLTDFTLRFTDKVAGSGICPANAVARRAALECAEEILRDPRIRQAVCQGDRSSDARLSGELLCWIYRLFFARLVTQFIQSAIAAKINLIAPGWQVVDPAGKLSEWITKHVMALLPNPCDQNDQKGESLTDLARDLLEESIQRALGIHSDIPGIT